MDGTVTLGILIYRKCRMFFKDTVFKTTLFFPPTVHYSHILPLKQTEEMKSGTLPGYRHYQYKQAF
jgi:hypothetical protein